MFISRLVSVASIFFLLLLSVAPIAAAEEPITVSANAISLENGYKIEPIITGLSVPTTAIFDGQDLLVAESGFLDTAKPRVLRISPTGASQIIAEAGLIGPVTGLAMKNGKLYISHRGKVSLLKENSTLQDIVTGLPSDGDHQNNNLRLGKDGKLYISQGTTTNSGVVGEDSYVYGWLQERPTAHDVPCQDVTLNGQNFETNNPLDKDKGKVSTGAFKPYKSTNTAGEIIKGDPKCSGAILRFNDDGSELQMYAWGLRNPFGLQFDSAGQLWATNHGADVRGSRAIFDDLDHMVQVKEGAWYGWPDYFDNAPVTDARFKALGKDQPQALLKNPPALTRSEISFPPHSGANGLAFSTSEDFGFKDQAFVALFGTYTPVTTGINVKPAGFAVTRLDPKNGQLHDFAQNKVPGPAYLTRSEGFNRPSDVVFAPDNSMYIVDWGASTIGGEGLKYVPGSGVIWRVYSEKGTSLRSKPVALVVNANPEAQRKSDAKNVVELYKELSVPLLVGAALFLIILILLIIYFIRRRRDLY